MVSNKRRRSSDSSSRSASKFAAVSGEQPPTFISLPAPRLPVTSTCPMKRRSPLTPPSVTPPSITVPDFSIMHRERCQSPGSRASALLAKVAVISSVPSTVPSSPRFCGSPSSRSNGMSSTDSTPTSTPPDDGGQFPFLLSKQLPESPNGGYISFPMFEAFGDYKDDEDGSVSPTHQ